LKRARQTISEREIEHLAELARIELSSREKAALRSQLNEIVRYFRMINEVDTESVPPTYHVQDLINVFRDDEPEPFDSDKVLKTVPQKKARFIKAPKMM